jgi:uncharacterized sulfatase
MIMRYDGRIPAGMASSALISNVDLAPTLLDFAGAELPGMDGISARPLMEGVTTSVRSSLLLEFVQSEGGIAPTYCGVRTRRYLFAHYTTGEEELYDLSTDPWQLRNVVGSRPSKADQLRELTVGLCDPLPPGFSW